MIDPDGTSIFQTMNVGNGPATHSHEGTNPTEQDSLLKRSLKEIWARLNDRRQATVLFLLVTIPVLYKNSLIPQWDKIIVVPGFGPLKNSQAFDVIFTLIVLAVSIHLIHLFWKRTAIPIYTGLYALLICIYLFLSFKSGNWIYFSWFNSTVSYVLIIELLLCGYFLLTLLSITLSVTQTKVELASGSLFVDEEITSHTQDKLGRTKAAEKIANHIHRSHSEKSTAFGLSAEWGSGKSSFIAMIVEAIEKKDSRAIIVKFNPWISKSPDKIISDFFDELQSALAPFKFNIASVIQRYSNSLTSIEENTYVRLLNSIISFIHPSKSSSELYDQLNREIKSVNRKIIIEVDDLDRLDKEEIIAVLKLIRNTANFYNTFYVVAFDREYIINAIKEINQSRPDLFLDKIFQAEANLPGFDKAVILEALREKLSDILTQSDLFELEKLFPTKTQERVLEEEIDDDDDIPNLIGNWCISNLRDVVRFCNNVQLTYTRELSDEVDISAFFRVQMLRLKFSKELDYFYQHYQEILWISREGSDLLLDIAISGSGMDPRTKSYERFEQYVLESNKPETSQFLRELDIMFRKRPTAEVDTFSVKWLSRFHLVFGANLFGDYFSESAFQQFLTIENAQVGDYYKQVEEKKQLFKLINRLFDLKAYSKALELERAVKLWFKMILESKIEFRDAVRHFLANGLAEDDRLPEDYDLETYKNFILDQFKAIEPLKERATIISLMIRQIIYDDMEVYYIINKSELLRINEELLKEQISKDGVNFLTLHIHACCLLEIVKNVIYTSEVADNLLLEAIKEKPEQYLESLILQKDPENRPKVYTFHPFRSYVFGNENEFAIWLKETVKKFPKKKVILDIYERTEQGKGKENSEFPLGVKKPDWVPPLSERYKKKQTLQ